jgi:hypothetical protein
MTFEVIPGSIAGHAGQLVLIEQREGAGKVQLRDLATAARSKVLLAAYAVERSGHTPSCTTPALNGARLMTMRRLLRASASGQ